ncbi:MAG: hypothetical protein R3F44_02595 [Candidatus Competibacteraceae bacterium]
MLNHVFSDHLPIAMEVRLPEECKVKGQEDKDRIEELHSLL